MCWHPRSLLCSKNGLRKTQGNMRNSTRALVKCSSWRQLWLYKQRQDNWPLEIRNVCYRKWCTVSFNEYSGRMKEDQKEIYYMLADSREKAEQTRILNISRKKVSKSFTWQILWTFLRFLTSLNMIKSRSCLSTSRYQPDKRRRVRLDSLSPEMANHW